MLSKFYAVAHNGHIMLHPWVFPTFFALLCRLQAATVSMCLGDPSGDFGAILEGLEMARMAIEEGTPQVHALGQQLFHAVKTCLEVEVFERLPGARVTMNPYALLGEAGVASMQNNYQHIEGLLSTQKCGSKYPFSQPKQYSSCPQPNIHYANSIKIGAYYPPRRASRSMRT